VVLSTTKNDPHEHPLIRASRDFYEKYKQQLGDVDNEAAKKEIEAQ
jgi:hypothetical protein